MNKAKRIRSSHDRVLSRAVEAVSQSFAINHPRRHLARRAISLVSSPIFQEPWDRHGSRLVYSRCTSGGAPVISRFFAMACTGGSGRRRGGDAGGARLCEVGTGVAVLWRRETSGIRGCDSECRGRGWYWSRWCYGSGRGGGGEIGWGGSVSQISYLHGGGGQITTFRSWWCLRWRSIVLVVFVAPGFLPED